MHNHDLSNRELYPRSHKWETEKKLNVISNKDINPFDRVLIDGDEHIVGAICKTDQVAPYILESVINVTPNSRFFEVKLL